MVKNLLANAGDEGLVQEDLLEVEMANSSSILAWKIPWTEEPGGLQCTVLQRVGHDSVYVYVSIVQARARAHTHTWLFEKT